MFEVKRGPDGTPIIDEGFAHGIRPALKEVEFTPASAAHAFNSWAKLNGGCAGYTADEALQLFDLDRIDAGCKPVGHLADRKMLVLNPPKE